MNDNLAFKIFRDVVAERRSVRKFSQREIPDKLLYELIELANRAPSALNLQPWHFIVVRDAALKRLLTHVALDQQQILEAPATVIFAADPECWKESYEQVLRLAVLNHSLSPEDAAQWQRLANLTFSLGPLGFFGVVKRLILPVLRFRKPMPALLTSHAEVAAHVRTQTMLAAQTFMLAAKAAGLDTCPIEGFDEFRLKKLLRIPHKMTVSLIVAVGYSLDVSDTPPTVRLSLDDKLSFEQFKPSTKKNVAKQ